MSCVKGNDGLFHISYREAETQWGSLCHTSAVPLRELARFEMHIVAPTCFACIDASAQLASVHRQQQATLAVMASRRRRS